MHTLKHALPTTLHLILVALIILIWEKVPDRVLESLKSPDPIVFSTIAYAITIGLIIAVTFVFERVFRTPVLASLSKDSNLAKFEGIWAQKISLPERPYSIGLIRFNAKSDCWEYSGVGFHPDFTPGATWHTSSSRYDDKVREWFFAGTASTVDNRDASYTVVPIIRIPRGVSHKLTGTVADIGAGGHRLIFDILEMKRITAPSDFDGDLSSPDSITDLRSDQVQTLLFKVALLSQGTSAGLSQSINKEQPKAELAPPVKNPNS
jgi:hypothetical protein